MSDGEKKEKRRLPDRQRKTRQLFRVSFVVRTDLEEGRHVPIYDQDTFDSRVQSTGV